MDLAPRSYRDWSELEQYTYRVAGALGGWITQRVGIRDPGLLPSAYALGHALQLTNVARDVGEDLGRGRLYLPLALLSDHGLEPADVERCASSGGPPPPAYRAAIETLLRRSDDWYARSWPGILTLPGWYRRPVAVASVTYQAIHQRIRKAGYDNLTRRARTSGPAKIGLACSALLRSVRGASPTGSARSRLDHPAALDCPDALG